MFEDHASRIHLLHQGKVVGRDNHSRARTVQLGEKAQQTLRKRRIDIAGRFVGQKKLRLINERARNRCALLLTA